MKKIFLLLLVICSSNLFSQNTQNHLFIDNLVGYGIFQENFPSSSPTQIGLFSTNVNMGHKFYFGSNEKVYQAGFVLTWFKFGFNVPTNFNFVLTSTNFSFGNIGYINNFNINENNSVELDLNFGLNSFSNYYLIIPNIGLGLEFSPKLVYQFKDFNLGYSLSLSAELSDSTIGKAYTYQLHSLVIGVKL